jgi:small subunit ribosomal protein S17
MGLTKVGTVVSKSGTKTVKVEVQRLVKHPVYKRYVRWTKGFLAHDEAEACGVGDQVEIVESRPLSARKRWRVRRIITRAQEGSAAARAIEVDTEA